MQSYQVIKEDIYEICKRRKLKLDELALSIYLRGKALRFGNPFYLTNKTICSELNITLKILRKVKSRLQTKGIIEYDNGQGNRHWTKYVMLDTVIMKGAQKVTFKGAHLAQSYISIIDKRRKKLKLVHCLSNNRMLIRSL